MRKIALSKSVQNGLIAIEIQMPKINASAYDQSIYSGPKESMEWVCKNSLLAS